MKLRNLSFVLLACVGLLAISCASGGVKEESETITDDPVILSRPYFEKPQARPLSRVLVTWSGVDGARGYQIQKSPGSGFSLIERSWTVSGTSLELPLDSGEIAWIRVRAFDGDTTSRWSAELEVKEGQL